jgi:hypothetical protein
LEYATRIVSSAPNDNSNNLLVLRQCSLENIATSPMNVSTHVRTSSLQTITSNAALFGSGGAESSDDDDADIHVAPVSTMAGGTNTESTDTYSSVSVDHVNVAEILSLRVVETSEFPIRDRTTLAAMGRVELCVSLSVCYGDSLVGDTTFGDGDRRTACVIPTVTSKQQMSARWNERLSLDALISDLPREAYVDIRLLAVRATNVVGTLGCARLTAFDFAGFLRHGPVHVALWPRDDPTSPMTAPVPIYADNVGGEAIVLTLRFDERVDNGSVFWRRHLNMVPAVVRVAFDSLSPTLRASFDDIVRSHSAITAMSSVECRSLWQWRRALVDRASALPLVLRAAPIGGGSMSAVIDEIHGLLRIWRAPDLPLLVALTLLGVEFVDTAVRRWAVTQLERVKDDDLMPVLMQLVQCVKHELYHDNALIRFLLHRAVVSPRIGQRLFWLLEVELQSDATHATRFGLILEAYLRVVPSARASLMRQQELVGRLSSLTGRLQTMNHAGTLIDAELQELSRNLSGSPVDDPLDCM